MAIPWYPREAILRDEQLDRERRRARRQQRVLALELFVVGVMLGVMLTKWWYGVG